MAAAKYSYSIFELRARLASHIEWTWTGGIYSGKSLAFLTGEARCNGIYLKPQPPCSLWLPIPTKLAKQRQTNKHFALGRYTAGQRPRHRWISRRGSELHIHAEVIFSERSVWRGGSRAPGPALRRVPGSQGVESTCRDDPTVVRRRILTYGSAAAAPSPTHVRKSSSPSAASGVEVHGLPGPLFVEFSAPKA